MKKREPGGAGGGGGEGGAGSKGHDEGRVKVPQKGTCLSRCQDALQADAVVGEQTECEGGPGDGNEDVKGEK